MLSVLIVDDEYRDRESMSHIIRRQNWSVNTYEAEYGQDALRILQDKHIDIMLTDIRMPDMLGTDLARQASVLQPGIKIILISAYKDFDYAQQGIRCGAVNYLLKPYLLEDFINAMDEAVKMCKSESEDTDGKAEIENQISKDRIMLSFLEEKRIDSRIMINNIIGNCKDGFQPVIIECIGGHAELSSLPFQEIISDVFKNKVEFFYINRKRALLIITAPELFLEQHGLSDKLVQSFETRGETEVCIVYGRILSDVTELFEEYRTLLSPLEICFFIDHSIILSSDSESIVQKENNLQINALTEQISAELRARDYDAVLEDITSIFEHFKKTNHFSALYVKYISANIVNLIFKNLHNGTAEQQLQPWLDRIFGLSTIYEITTVFEELINELRSIEESTDRSLMISRIYSLIETEYMSAELNLETVANKLYISSSYLSHLFKRETGENFIDYLKNFRLKKSCELLKNTNLRISQICNRVGYESTSYFCTLFKNTYGITPTQYRERGYKNIP